MPATAQKLRASAANPNAKIQAATKTDGKGKHRYVTGVVSGLAEDYHGDRMSTETILGFQKQAGEKNIKLIADLHGKGSLDDIGILTASKILPNTDWWCEFMLYDESHGMPQHTLEFNEKLWKQINGLPPYEHAEAKGFSIEGLGPKRLFNKAATDGPGEWGYIDLDGVVIAPKVAYLASTATPVFKTMLDEAKRMVEAQSQPTPANSWNLLWALTDALRDACQGIMQEKNLSSEKKRAALDLALEDFSKSYASVVMANASDYEQSGPPIESYLQEVQRASAAAKRYVGASAKACKPSRESVKALAQLKALDGAKAVRKTATCTTAPIAALNTGLKEILQAWTRKN